MCEMSIASLCCESSSQVAGVLLFGFGLSDDVPQTSSSNADLDQLASQGGSVHLLNPSCQLAIKK